MFQFLSLYFYSTTSTLQNSSATRLFLSFYPYQAQRVRERPVSFQQLSNLCLHRLVVKAPKLPAESADGQVKGASQCYLLRFTLYVFILNFVTDQLVIRLCRYVSVYSTTAA